MRGFACSNVAIVRRAITWFVALPVIVVGSQVAHGLAYWWAYPIANVRDAILQQSGHGYEAYAPLLLGLLAAIQLFVVLVAVADRVREQRSVRGLPPWAFLWLPVVGFTLQEHLERLFMAGVFPWRAVEEPTFWRGLLLQIPIGLLAYAVARLLLRTVDAVARAITEHRRNGRRVRVCPPSPAPRQSVLLPRPAALALAAAGRAPPRPRLR